eukprot:TRINITY_DN40829_c0_g1_i1.p1 TRINITY_DN40829_c0_g1~~TRINITY_DN40829_c0_g1_i1.p1  ORF type:complete len:764 (+),score=147.23 TRINITY_DN40829_c0_g1_i1:68-2359(+)
MGKEKSRERDNKEKKDRKRSRSRSDKEDKPKKERRTSRGRKDADVEDKKKREERKLKEKEREKQKEKEREERRKEEKKREEEKQRRKEKEKEEKKRSKRGGWDVIPEFTPEQIQSALLGIAPSNPLAIAVSPLAPVDRQSRRLYVGNPPTNTNEAELKQFFQDQIAIAEVQRKKIQVEAMGGDPSRITAQTIQVPQVVDVQLSRGDDGSKPYAFIELNSAEATTEALALDGIRFKDCVLKIRRPRDYIGDALPSSVVPGVIGTQVPDGPNKVFMGGLPLGMSEEEVKGLLQSFGQLRNFNMVRDPQTGLSRGYCFFDFVDPSVTDKVISSLNTLKLGDKSLIVQRANANAITAGPTTAGGMSNALVIASPTPTTSAGGAMVPAGGGVVFVPGQGHVPVPPADPERNFLSALLNLSTPLSVAVGLMGQMPICKNLGKAAPVLTNGTIVVRTTRTLVLCNILTEEELEDDDEYDDIEQEIETEVEKYGRVLKLIIPRRYPAPPVIPAHCNGVPPSPRLAIEGGERRLQIMAPGMYGPPPRAAVQTPFSVMGPRGPVVVWRGPAGDEATHRQKTEEAEYLEKRKEWEQLMKDPLKSGVGMVFVQYITVDEAHKAQVAMAGKRFNGRTVITSFLPDDYMERIDAEETREERELELRIAAADKVLAIMEKKELEELEQRTKEEVARAVAAAATAPAPPPPDGLPPDLMGFLGSNPYVPSGMSLGLGLQGTTPAPAGSEPVTQQNTEAPADSQPTENPTGMSAMEADLD